jgi:hypothetical protein
MTDESVFRSLVIINIAVTLPIGLYHRIRSQTTGEALAGREEGSFIMRNTAENPIRQFVSGETPGERPVTDACLRSERNWLKRNSLTFQEVFG